ncbi:MAG: hypothetical protein DRO14_02755 [Thermoprotei archaeon]|mgnify:CR=1 FL=1|nr:MAG: hypothetical protein DRO14_02755 [Thermoprotei archaeon]
MVLDYYFEVSTYVKPTDVVEMLSNPTVLLPLWSIYEALTEVKSLDEFIAKLNIAGTSFTVKFKLRKITEENKTTITLIGMGSISIRVILRVEPREAGSTIKCRISVRAGFFRERSISSIISSFVEDLKNKFIFQLPLLAEALITGKERYSRGEVRAKAKELAAVRESGSTNLLQKEEERKPEELTAIETKRLEFSADPSALRDDVFLSMVVLKSTLIKYKQVDVKGKEILRVIEDYVLRGLKKSGSTFYISINCASLHIKMYIKNMVVEGLRIEFNNGHILNGQEALRYLSTVRNLSCRAYVFSVSE